MKSRYAVVGLALSLLSAGLAYASEELNGSSSGHQFGDWSVACVEKNNVRVCEARTLVRDQDGSPLVKLAVVRSEYKDMIFEVMVPLLTDLKKGLRLGVHGKYVNFETRMPYDYCIPAGCIVKADTGSLLDKFKIGKEIQASFSSVFHGEVKSKASLMGFTEAYQYLISQP